MGYPLSVGDAIVTVAFDVEVAVAFEVAFEVVFDLELPPSAAADKSDSKWIRK